MTEFAPSGQRDVFKGFFEAVGTSCKRMQNIGEAFGKYLAGAGGFAATKAAHGEL